MALPALSLYHQEKQKSVNRRRTFVISSPATLELLVVRGSGFLTDSLVDCADERLSRWSCLCSLTVSAARSINNPRDTSSAFVCTWRQFLHAISQSLGMFKVTHKRHVSLRYPQQWQSYTVTNHNLCHFTKFKTVSSVNKIVSLNTKWVFL